MYRTKWNIQSVSSQKRENCNCFKLHNNIAQ